MKFEYLIFNILICLFPLAGKLWKKDINIDGKKFVQAWIPVMIIFVVLDFLVIGRWWNFNNAYITGFNIGGKLPIEELMFFVTVPWACVLLWEATYHDHPDQSEKIPARIGRKWWVIAGMVFWLFRGWEYTAVMCWGLAIMGAKIAKLWSNRLFWLWLGILITIFNGYLTGRPVVIYQNRFKTNIKLATIPIEDFLFGYLLVGSVIYKYQTKTNK